MNSVITPTPGRIVWYWPSTNDGLSALAGQPLAAIVAAVHDDRHVNLSVVDAHGNHHGRTNVFLSQPDQERPVSRDYGFAEWMPYQKGQAAKVEQVQSALAEAISTDGVGVTTPAMFAETNGTSASEIGLVTPAEPAAEAPVEAPVEAPAASEAPAPTE